VIRASRRLPEPLWLRVVLAALLVAAALAMLLAGYEWLGRVFLDDGGTMG